MASYIEASERRKATFPQIALKEIMSTVVNTAANLHRKYQQPTKSGIEVTRKVTAVKDADLVNDMLNSNHWLF